MFSFAVASMSSIDVHIGMSTLVDGFYADISWSLFSTWPWWDNQSAICNSGPGLYKMHTLY